MGLFDDILLTVDYDRTLTATDSTIPANNLEAIRFFMDNGGSFTVNTGRSVPMCQAELIPQVSVNAPLLLYNGSAAYDVEKGELILCRPIPLDPDQVVAELRQRFPELVIEIQGRDAHYVFEKNPGWEEYCSYNGCRWDYEIPGKIPGPFLKFVVNGKFREPTVASMYRGTREEIALIDRAVAYVQETYGDVVDVFRACARIADVHAKGSNKLRSARDLQKKLGKKILVCVGDGENDAQMLAGADYGWCPADAAVADCFPNVCPCDEGAVAEVIYKKIPGILGKQLDKPE